MEKSVKDVKQGQKVDLDLVESIIRPTCLVKEELLRILMKTSQFRTKIQEYKVCTFWTSGKFTDFRRRLPAGAK